MIQKIAFALLMMLVTCPPVSGEETVADGLSAQMPERHPAADPAHVESVLGAREAALNGVSFETGTNVDIWEETFPNRTLFVSCNTSMPDCNAHEMQSALTKKDDEERRPDLLGQMLEKRADGTTWLHFGFTDPEE